MPSSRACFFAAGIQDTECAGGDFNIELRAGDEAAGPSYHEHLVYPSSRYSQPCVWAPHAFFYNCSCD